MDKNSQSKHMKQLTTLTNIIGAMATLTLMAACQTVATNDAELAASKKEFLLAQSGFKVITVTTPQQQQAVSGLNQGRVSAVTYNGKLYYVYPTAKKDRIYVGRQKQFTAYKTGARGAVCQPSSQPDGGSARSGADGRTVSDAHARDRRTQQHRSSAVRWVWSDGRERPGRLVKE